MTVLSPRMYMIQLPKPSSPTCKDVYSPKKMPPAMPPQIMKKACISGMMKSGSYMPRQTVRR